MKQRQPQGTQRKQAGSMAVELALLFVFILMPMLLGVVDFGQLLLAQAAVTRAAREGVLAASRDQDATKAVSTYLQNAGYDPNQTTVTTSGNGLSGTPVTVTVRYSTSQMSIIPWSAIDADMSEVIGSATGRKT